MRGVAQGLLPVELYELPNRLSTYSVQVRRRGYLVLVGYVRWREDGIWVARSLGSRFDAADVRNFCSQERATAWLQREAERTELWKQEVQHELE